MTDSSSHSEAPTQWRILVVGCGSIGIRHIRNLKALGQRHVSAFSSASRVAQAAHSFDVIPYDSLDEALTTEPEVVLVCNSTHLHLTTALHAIDAGAHLFIEKPISHTLDGLPQLLQKAKDGGRRVMVGYNMRFHPVLRAVRDVVQAGTIGRILHAEAEMGQFLPTWRVGRAYQETYTARREMGGGIVLDMSHELDYLLWLFGPVSSVACLAEHASSLDVNVEDMASMLLRFQSGAMGAVHLDFVQRGYERRGKAIGDAGVLRWRFKEPVVEYRNDETNDWERIEFPTYDLNQMYIDEISHFLTCLENGTRPEIGIREGEAALRLALAALTSAESMRFEDV